MFFHNLERAFERETVCDAAGRPSASPRPGEAAGQQSWAWRVGNTCLCCTPVTSPSPTTRFEELFAQHRTAAIPDLWPWQREVLAACEATARDVAIDLPTGTGKTLLGLLIGEDCRQAGHGPVAYVAGNKSLARQVERQARDLRIPIVRFQGSKDGWSNADVRTYNFGDAVGVMNYWNYFNASPGIEAAGLLILDDVHLLETPLRDMYTVTIPRADALYDEVLRRIVGTCPYYSLAADYLNGVVPPGPPEMLVFPDSADLADEVRGLLDGRLLNGSSSWWAWQQIRQRLEICCWLVSARAVTFTPYIPPSQTYPHFAGPSRRIYMSATIGTVDDLRRRLGAPPLAKVSSSVQPRQGERAVVLSDAVETPTIAEMVDGMRELLAISPKALWLCARKETATTVMAALQAARLPGAVRLLEGDNGADEAFASDGEGHLVAAGRYDGMDFPDEACRIEVLPEIPVGTTDLEEWTTAYLRDAGFADARFSQRLAQALGRCNRSQDDRAVYVLADPEFLSRLSERRTTDLLPDDVYGDIFGALRRSDAGFEEGLREAGRFLAGEDILPAAAPVRAAVTPAPSTGTDEVDGFIALWLEDYARAAELFDAAAAGLGSRPEHQAFWLAMRALALGQIARYGDRAAAADASQALATAAKAGSSSTFFTRLRLSSTRLSGKQPDFAAGEPDAIFSAWDAVISRYGSAGPRFEKWSAALVDELASDDHDTVARGIARFGDEVLGLSAAAPKATSGEADAEWEFAQPHRVLTFEVKLAPTSKRVVNDDVEQAEGATRAAAATRGVSARGLLVTPWPDADQTALQRLDRVRLISRDVLVGEARFALGLLQDYRRGWSDEAQARADRRRAVQPHIPPFDWLWRAQEASVGWVDTAALAAARRPKGR